MKLSVAAAIAALVAFAAAGCTVVQSHVTVFTTLPAQADGKSIAIIPVDQKLFATMEFRAYSEKLGGYLQKAGYRVIDPTTNEKPDYIAVFGYGIDNGSFVTTTSSSPVYGVTGYSGSTTMGTVNTFGNMATVSAQTTKTPIYGVVGSEEDTRTTQVYKRDLLLDIFDNSRMTKDPESAKVAQVYQAKLISAGSCGSMAGVMDPLLESLFKDFPGENGSTRTVNVRGAKGC